MSRCEFDPVDVQEKNGAVWSKKRYEIQTEFELWHTAALWQIMKNFLLDVKVELCGYRLMV